MKMVHICRADKTEHDDRENQPDEEYIPAPGSINHRPGNRIFSKTICMEGYHPAKHDNN